MTTPARASENTRQAVAGLEAVAGFARALAEGDRPPGARPVPGQARERVARTVCALRHLADQYPGLSFETMLDAAGEQDRQPGAGRAREAVAAAVACDRALSAPGQLAGGSWPPGTDYLQAHATRQGQQPQEAVAALATGLLAGLRHYAGAQGASFREALAAGLAAHARQRLLAESPFRTGQDPAPRPASQATAPFTPCATHQGVVVSAADAEWLLVRTAARNYASGLIPARAGSYASEFAGPPDPRDADDERALNRALADARGLHPNQVFADVAPGIAARIMQLTDGPGKAAELGREHGRSGTPPYCDIRTEGEAAALMGALGETEPMTDANRQYRALLVTEYAGAYRDAARRAAPGRISRPHRGPRPPPRRPANRRDRNPRSPPPQRAAGPAASRPPPWRLMTSRRNQPDASKETALMMTIQWTPEAIRALGATTDLPTLGEIFGLSTWRSREMAKTGEWEQAGIRILKMGSRYRVTVPSILDVLGVPGDDGTPADGETPADDAGDGQDNATVPLTEADGHADGTAASPPAPEAALPAHELPAGNGHLRPAAIRPPAQAGAPRPER